MAAQFALRDSRIEAHPLKTRDVVRACDRAVTAADALGFVPANRAGFRILVQSLERASGSTSRLQAVHALALDERRRAAVRRFVEFDYVTGEIVEIVRRLVQAIAASIGRRVI